MLHKAWNSNGEMPYCFTRSSIKFQGHTGQNITHFDPNWAFPDYRPVAAFKSLRFALLMIWQPLPSYPDHLSHKIKRGHDLMDKSRRQLSSNVMLGSFYCYRRRLLLLKQLISRLSPSNHWMSFNRCMWRVPYYVSEWKPGKIER